MVAVIKTGHSLIRILNYNENKVQEGVAHCIGEHNYPMDAAAMGFSMKLGMLERLASLNEKVVRNSVHISLNFDPSEAALQDGVLMRLADDYMEGIGFGGQPYLVYRHHDAGHPHIHIVSVKVRPDGSRIDMQNIGRDRSTTVRKALEGRYGLIPAESSRRPQGYVPQPIVPAKVAYGKRATKSAIAAVLQTVLPHYRYASLAELNAILMQYNVMADRGKVTSRTFLNEGLLYRVLDEKGKPVGVPIKASDFHDKPTLAALEVRFERNRVLRQPHRARVKNALDLAFIKNPPATLAALGTLLQKEGITLVPRKSADGRLYGVTYIDHTTRCVFNGSDLGKAYSAKAIEGHFPAAALQPGKTQGMPQNTALLAPKNAAPPGPVPDNATAVSALAGALLSPEFGEGHLPGGFKKKKKKKRRKK